MSKAIRLEDEASAELQDAVNWYEERQASLGRRYLEALDSTFRQLLRFVSSPSLTTGGVRAIGIIACDIGWDANRPYKRTAGFRRPPPFRMGELSDCPRCYFP